MKPYGAHMETLCNWLAFKIKCGSSVYAIHSIHTFLGAGVYVINSTHILSLGVGVCIKFLLHTQTHTWGSVSVHVTHLHYHYSTLGT